MLPLSDIKITLDKPSMDYQRVCIVIYGVAMLMLWYSVAWLYAKICLSIFLCTILIKLVRQNIPYPVYTSLRFYKQGWHLHHKNGLVLTYTQAQIRVDTGFFLLLTLTDEATQKNIVIFNDQLSIFERRMLYLIEKIKVNVKNLC